MSDAMSIATIRETFPNEWVTAQVTEVDESDVPAAGVVLTHSADEDAVFQALKLYRANHPGTRCYTFFTGEVIPEDIHIAFPIG